MLLATIVSLHRDLFSVYRLALWLLMEPEGLAVFAGDWLRGVLVPARDPGGDALGARVGSMESCKNVSTDYSSSEGVTLPQARSRRLCSRSHKELSC